jgi:hypothetical protein
LDELFAKQSQIEEKVLKLRTKHYLKGKMAEKKLSSTSQNTEESRYLQLFVRQENLNSSLKVARNLLSQQSTEREFLREVVSYFFSFPANYCEYFAIIIAGTRKGKTSNSWT